MHEMHIIKDELNKNKIKMKAGLRKKWYMNNNATTQIALYKLISNEDELIRLNNQDITSKGEAIRPIQITVVDTNQGIEVEK